MPTEPRNRVVIALIAAMLASVLTMTSTTPAGAAFAPSLSSTHEPQFVQKINAERSAAGLQPLVMDAGMREAARDWALEMATGDFLAHAPDISVGLPDGWTAGGENVGIGGTVSGLHAAFMASAGHRANIMDPGFNVIGVGVYINNGTMYTTHRFGTVPGYTGGGNQTPPTSTPVPPTATPRPTSTPVPPTATPRPTSTPVPPTATPIPPTSTPIPVPPTATPIPPTSTPVPVPPTATARPVIPTATAAPVIPTATPRPIIPTATPRPVIPTATAVPPTATTAPARPTATSAPARPTATAVRPTATAVRPTATAAPARPTATPRPTSTTTPARPTATPRPTSTTTPGQPTATSAPAQPTATSAPAQPGATTAPTATPSPDSSGPLATSVPADPTATSTPTTDTGTNPANPNLGEAPDQLAFVEENTPAAPAALRLNQGILSQPIPARGGFTSPELTAGIGDVVSESVRVLRSIIKGR